MENLTPHQSAWKARLPQLTITVGTVFVFYILIRCFEGVPFKRYPDQQLLPQTAFILMSLLAMGAMWWLNAHKWSYYLLMHIFALGFGTAVLVTWAPYEFGPVGVGSDSWFSTAMIVKFKHHWGSQDFGYKGLHAFYPSLYHWLVGKFAALSGTLAVRSVKYGLYWTAFLLPLFSYALWRKLLGEMPAILMVVFALYITRNHLAFKPFEVAPACLFLPWALYYIIGVRQISTAEGPRYQFQALTRRESIIGGVIGGLIFMTYYYYFFLFVLWIPIQFAVMRRTGQDWKEVLRWVKGFAFVFGIAMVISAVYWAPLLLDMAKYGGQSFQNRWFQPNMFGLPLDISNQWRPLLGLMALLLLARRNMLASTALSGAVAVLAFMVLGHWGMYSGFPILHFRMVGMDEQLMHVGLILGGMEVLRRYTSLLASTWEKALPVAIITIFCVGIGMVYTWEKGNEISTLAADTKTPVMVAIPEFDQVAKGKVFLTNRIDLVAFKPMFLFLVPNAHYNHPAARYRERLKMLLLLSHSTDSRFLAWMLQHNRYDAVDRILLDRNTLTAFDDNFPVGDNHIQVDITFADSAFTGSFFPPNTYFGEIRQVQPQSPDLWKEFTPAQRLLVALFTDVDPQAVRATLNPATLQAAQDEIRIPTKDYPTWQRVFWARYGAD